MRQLKFESLATFPDPQESVLIDGIDFDLESTQEMDSNFQEFFEAEYRPLRRLAFVLSGSWSEAEDLTQEALLRTYVSWDRIRDREHPGAYTRTVLINKHRSIIRHFNFARKHSNADQQSVSELDTDGIEMWDAIRRLPERYRAVLALRYYEDLPEAQIATILDCPIGTVKSLIHRGLNRLRSQVQSNEENRRGEVS